MVKQSSNKYLFLGIAVLSFTICKTAVAKDNNYDNYFCPDDMAFGGKFDFIHADSDWYSVTDKSSWHGIKTIQSGKYKGCIDVMVEGRYNSSTNVDWVRDKKLASNIHWDSKHMTDTMSSYPGEAKPPVELNFAVYGTFIYTDNNGSQFKCDNVVIAQGTTTGNYHNWWVFNNNTSAKNSLLCTDNNGSSKLLFPHRGYNTLAYYMAFSH